MYITRTFLYTGITCTYSEDNEIMRDIRELMFNAISVNKGIHIFVYIYVYQILTYYIF